MRRAFIIAAWIAGTTLPLLVATVFYFGCCVLPFHRVLHEVAPLCHAASTSHDNDPHDTVPPAKRITGIAPSSIRLASIAAERFDPLPRPVAYRDFIAHGAVRCDRDVGLHLLVETFRI
ncbi:MAG TPA: hypothetical protein VKB93_21925 [Thermoanaerobaculia bacterium]|nr:hypothetical protein [Thermoanaerobaculia bacterium]